jgi:hypothetical protein
MESTAHDVASEVTKFLACLLLHATPSRVALKQYYAKHSTCPVHAPALSQWSHMLGGLLLCIWSELWFLEGKANCCVAQSRLCLFFPFQETEPCIAKQIHVHGNDDCRGTDRQSLMLRLKQRFLKQRGPRARRPLGERKRERHHKFLQACTACLHGIRMHVNMRAHLGRRVCTHTFVYDRK